MTEKLTGTELIRAKMRTLPQAPGVYRMFNAVGDVLYVGKAKNLRNRVTSYTRLNGHSNRIARMIHETRDMEFVRTETETDALLLEANLIRKLKPFYNVRLRDDKSFPYILLTGDHDIAQLVKHRGSQKRAGQYFGPFASAGAVNRALNALQRAFLLRSCSDSVYKNRTRPCLLYQIKRCAAPCTGEVSRDDYQNLVDEARAFLAGRSREVQEKLVQKMQAASEALNFEDAALARDRIRALTYIQAENAINPRHVQDADILALAEQGGQICVQIFFIRAGQNLGTKAYFPRHDRDMARADVLEAFLGQFYTNRPVPKQILINCDVSGHALLEEALSVYATHKVKISRPQRGEKLLLVNHAAQNAQEALVRFMTESATQKKLHKDLAEIFALDAPPQRIEVFDNSHLQGTGQIGGMIVAGVEGFMKNQYRKFNIKDPTTIAGDDYAMMREVFTRRYTRLAAEEQPAGDNWPDLILIDGGRGQLNVAHKVMQELGLDDIPLVGIAKGPDRNAGRERFFMIGRDEFSLPPNMPALFYVQRLRDEAHRFAIGAQRHKRKQQIRGTKLDNISGIGAARKRALLHHFGSAGAVERAARDDLEKVEGINARIAQRIYDYFHEQETPLSQSIKLS